MRTTPWPVLAGIGLALLSASVASAAGPASTAAISNGVLALGVSSDGGLAQGGLGVKFAPTGTDGLPASCACGVRLTVGSTTLSESIESFTFTATTANSSVLATDPASGTQLRMTQDFHPSTVAPNLYEVVVTVDNLGSSAVQATYARGLTWLTPTHEFDVALPSIAPGGSVAFRLYIGAGTSLGDATSGFVPEGASLVAQLPGATTFVFGYAAGQTPGPSGSGGSGGSGGGGGGGGGGGAGGSGGGAPSGNAGAVDAGQPQAAPSATSATPTATSTTSTSTSTSASTSASAAATAASLGGTPTATTTTSGATPTSTAASSTPTPTTVTNATPTATSATPTATSTEVPKSTATPVVKLDLDPPSDPIGSLPGFEPQATPELDSLTLMASGLGGIGVYALARWRARKRDRD